MIPLWCLKLPKIMEIKNLRRPGIEPGSIAWEATMLTFTPPTHRDTYEENVNNNLLRWFNL